MNIFHMLGTIDLKCFNTSLSTRDMVTPTKKIPSKDIGEISIEGIVESHLILVPIYAGIDCYMDK